MQHHCLIQSFLRMQDLKIYIYIQLVKYWLSTMLIIMHGNSNINEMFILQNKFFSKIAFCLIKMHVENKLPLLQTNTEQLLNSKFPKTLKMFR